MLIMFEKIVKKKTLNVMGSKLFYSSILGPCECSNVSNVGNVPNIGKKSDTLEFR